MITLFFIRYFNFSGNTISRFHGWLANVQLPHFIRAWAFTQFARAFGINLNEVEAPLDTYSSFNAFFTRALTQTCRPICSDPQAVLCPVDAKVQEWGPINSNVLIQAKGISYTLEKLIPGTHAHRFEHGQFITYYLAPHDCHRIFSPVSGHIEGVCHVPGALYPVREPCISQLPGLYTHNERVITYISTPQGWVAVVKVGALNVGSMAVTYDPSIRSNRPHNTYQERFYPQKKSIQKGDWLGTFYLGSTVILLFEKGMLTPDWTYKKVNYGEKIGILCPSKL